MRNQAQFVKSRVELRVLDPKDEGTPVGVKRSNQSEASVGIALESTSVEPDAEQLASEQVLLKENLQLLGGVRTCRTSASKDPLAFYMEVLSRIPLFTPEEELEAARVLATLEEAAWFRLLSIPRGARYAAIESEEHSPELAERLWALYQNYRRAKKRAPDAQPRIRGRRKKNIETLASDLRRQDADNRILDGALKRLRRDLFSWGGAFARDGFAVGEEEFLDLQRVRKAAARGRNNFVRANLRLVVSVARGFRNRYVPLSDLIQEGNVGLMKAINRFDHRRGFRFSTYAHWWIRQSIERAILNTGHHLRLPVHVIESRRKIERARKRLQFELGRSPETDEIARRTQMTQRKVQEIRDCVRQDAISLDDTFGAEGGRMLDILPDDSVPQTDEFSIQRSMQGRLHELLKLLSPMETEILRRRFGFDRCDDETLEEIGKTYNLSRERVRQIQVQGLHKMRRMCERREIGLAG